MNNRSECTLIFAGDWEYDLKWMNNRRITFFGKSGS